MSKSGYINARIEPSLKTEVAEILQGLGLSTSEAITLYFKQIVLQKGLPFAVKVPNAETAQSMRNILVRSPDLQEYNSFEDVLAEINEEMV